MRANGANLTSFVSNVLTRSGEQRYRGEIQLGDPLTGRPLPVEAVAGTILSEQGELMWVVTILHDLTEAIEKARLYEQLKQASVELERKVQEATAELAEQNELLRRQHIELEQASALKSQFLANMSHEFRTPLNAILGYTHMLLNNVTGQVTDPQRKSLTRIDSNSRHLLALINDILDITRIEAGRMPLNATSFGIGELFDEVQAELEPIIKRSNLAVTTKVRGAVPSVRSDRQKVKQIVLNLLSNALKFTPAGSVTMTASYDARAQPGGDRGQATPASAFRRRTRRRSSRTSASSTRRRRAATAAPASACRSAAAWRNILGGTIELDSTPGKGSTFTLRLPAKATAPMSAPTKTREQPLVLVVEDYQDAREMYAAYLQFSGFEVAEAGNGIEAIEKTHELLPDIVLMDLALPRMDGWEATRRLKNDERTRHIPIVALTGHALAGHAEGAREAGCDAFVTKPCLPDALVAEIKRLLDAAPREVGQCEAIRRRAPKSTKKRT